MRVSMMGYSKDQKGFRRQTKPNDFMLMLISYMYMQSKDFLLIVIIQNYRLNRKEK